MAETNVTEKTFEIETVAEIRHMLLIGLASYGELLRLEEAVRHERLCNREPSPSMIPADITGSADTVGDFANALRLLG